MATIANLYQSAKKKSSLTGIIITDLIAFISYVIFPSGLVYYGDIQMIIGCFVGIRFTLKNIQPNKSYISYGIVIGLIGAIITGISYSLFDWIIFSDILLFSLFTFLIILELYFIEAIIIGITVGLVIGGYYNYRNKSLVESSEIKDPFYESLIDK